MNHLLYFNIRLIIAGMLLIVGACLTWGVIPPKLRGTTFDSSRKCIGIAIMIMPFSTFVVYFLSLRTLMFNLHIASYLTACYSISILVTVGFVPLLGGTLNFKNLHFKKRFIRGLVGIPIFTLPMLLANIYGDEHMAQIMKFTTVAMLLLAFSYQSLTLGRLYRQAIRRGDNYYSDDVEVDISWIIKSVIAIYSLEIICIMSIFYPAMGYSVEMLLTIYRAVTIIYVFSQFIKFMMNFETMMSVCENPQIEDVNPNIDESYYQTLSEEQQSQIEMRLTKWVEQKGYIKSGVTIDNIASEVATNRTYLSIYINTTFGCSFKVWITGLRVQLSKELLLGDDTTADISRNIGFASPQSFMHSFKRSEGVTPTQWRNNNR